MFKLLERCPLKYFLVQSLVSVVPQKLASDSAEAQVKFEQLLRFLLNGKWCLAEACNEILTQCKGFVLEMKQNHLAEFLSFNMNTDRLDEFYWNYTKDAEHSNVWEVFRIIFMLLHGQAAVERGFLVNSELLVENLLEKTFVVSCIVYSSVKSDANHFSELSFTPRLKRNVQAARMHISCMKKSKENFMLKVIKLKS